MGRSRSEKFRLLIQEVKELIDGLQDITNGLSSIAQQDEVISSRIMNIRDVTTLELVADVCEDDHPQVAYAASTRADPISGKSTRRQHITAWSSGVESDESDDVSAATLEDLTMTQLKHQISRLLRDEEEREAWRTKANAAAIPEEATVEQERSNGLDGETLKE